MQRLLTDVRSGLRQIRRSPRFFALLGVMLIGGIGATTAMFSIVSALLSSPLPFAHPERLTTVWATRPGNDRLGMSLRDFLDWKAQATSFEQVTVAIGWMFSLASPAKPPEGVVGVHVSGDFFPMLGVLPLRGRLLRPEDDRVGGPRVAVLGAALWRRRFGSDPSLVGRTIELDADTYTVVGIAPEGFSFSYPGNEPVHVWTPMAVSFPWYVQEVEVPALFDQHQASGMARLKPGVSAQQAQSELCAVAHRTEQARHVDYGIGARVLDMHEEIVGPARLSLLICSAAVGLAFLVVCANVATLLLARARARRAEFAARAALGATRARLVQQTITETLVLFLIAVPGSALTASVLVHLFYRLTVGEGSGARADVVYQVAPALQFLYDRGAGIEARALLFCVLVSLFAGLMFGLVPAFSAFRTPLSSMREASGTGAPVGRWQGSLRGALVVSQVALAFALLAGGGVALKAVTELRRTPAGFDPDGLVTVKMLGLSKNYATSARFSALSARVLALIEAQPGVESVAANTSPPLQGSNSAIFFDIQARAPWPPGEQPRLVHNVVTPGYFRTMRIPMLQGRDFTATDAGKPVVIIGQMLAERFFSGQDPIGQGLRHRNDDSGNEFRKVIGVVGDVRRHGLAEPPTPESYTPYSSGNYLEIVARSDRADWLLRELPRLVASVDPTLGAQPVMMAAALWGTVRYQTLITLLLCAFAAIALLLASVGIYSLVSFTAAQRTRELGIRVALGSPLSAVVWCVVREGLFWIGLGLALGLCGALAMGSVVSSRIPGARGFDLGVYLVIALLLGGAGLLACLVPAWRALRVPAAVALRQE